jgi:hypothetical protein
VSAITEAPGSTLFGWRSFHQPGPLRVVAGDMERATRDFHVNDEALATSG